MKTSSILSLRLLGPATPHTLVDNTKYTVLKMVPHENVFNTKS